MSVFLAPRQKRREHQSDFDVRDFRDVRTDGTGTDTSRKIRIDLITHRDALRSYSVHCGAES